jgi:tetratricopeptide (TPR) repeat protein
MFNKPTHYLIGALVSLMLASMACNFFTIRSQTASPITSQSTSFPAASTPLAVQSSSFSDRLNAVQDEVHQANTLMQQQQYASAIIIWDDLLTRVPEYADAYYQRSLSYRYLTSNQRIQTEYLDYLHHALADLNQAISLAPEMGDYYFARYQVEEALANNEMYLVDKNFWFTQAYQDITLANQYETKGELADREPGFLLIELGRCEEAVDEFNRLIKINTGEPSAGLTTGLANSSQCLGKYDEALKYIDTAIRLYPSFQRAMARATILYNMGRFDEALSEVNKLIADQRFYCGCRYYLRALIYYDQGKKDLAQADIDFGTGQTWGRGGIRSYVLGHLALDAGDQRQGIALLQEAEASLNWQYGSLRERVLKELETLGSTPLSLSVSVPATPTLLPVTPQIQLPTPTMIPLDRPRNVQPILILYSGNSSITFIPGKSMTFQFVPPQPLPYPAVQALVFTLEGDVHVQNRVVELEVWRPGYDDSKKFTFDKLGKLPIPNGADYVTRNGEIYAVITIKGDQPTPVDVIGVTLTVSNANGGTSQYGLPLSP